MQTAELPVENLESVSAKPISTAKSIELAWSKIAPFWPLKNLIAVNPLAGFEDLHFEDALPLSAAYFQQKEMPEPMLAANRATIKWLQLFFDSGQATIKMPLRERGLYSSVRTLLAYDDTVAPKTVAEKAWFATLSKDPKTAIESCLNHLGIPTAKRTEFLTLMLTTLPGWAGHVQYRVSWPDAADRKHPNAVTHEDYLALRLTLVCLVWPEAKNLLSWHEKALQGANMANTIAEIKTREHDFARNILSKFTAIAAPETKKAYAQMVFCIDVRSEPFRRAIEAQGAYETFGFAGFFGLPVAIHNKIKQENYASCPVLLQPSDTITVQPSCKHDECQKAEKRNIGLVRLFQSLKYSFSTPFALVETLGPLSAIWMATKTLFPRFFNAVSNAAYPEYDFAPLATGLSIEKQSAFAAGALQTMGLNSNFADLVVFCGHGSQTQNNAFATALDCGACGGRHGAPNARLLATICNNPEVRQALAERDIFIPETTYFIGAEHNTTTDGVQLFLNDLPAKWAPIAHALMADLQAAQSTNSQWRAAEMGSNIAANEAAAFTNLRATDWAQVRPEWALARNAAFVVAPRHISQAINLDGRCFLHSYRWEQDTTGAALTTILTAPMVVAQWINSQYLFSTLDNVAYGAGSKVTSNITGKIGMMQGNASDLMTGLPLQSVNITDALPYHSPQRLLTIVYAPRVALDEIISKQAVLQKLFGNAWVRLACIEPYTNAKYMLRTDFSWQLAS
jgi:uncharacterized protein YbcC (UPF0753/DUF2309 family)